MHSTQTGIYILPRSPSILSHTTHEYMHTQYAHRDSHVCILTQAHHVHTCMHSHTHTQHYFSFSVNNRNLESKHLLGCLKPLVWLLIQGERVKREK